MMTANNKMPPNTIHYPFQKQTPKSKPSVNLVALKVNIVSLSSAGSVAASKLRSKCQIYLMNCCVINIKKAGLGSLARLTALDISPLIIFTRSLIRCRLAPVIATIFTRWSVSSASLFILGWSLRSPVG